MDERMESFFENQNFTKIHVMFQMLFYFVHKGQKKAPLAVITGHTVYDKCKSRELITALNKIDVSTSYNKVLTNRKNKLTDYVLASSINERPQLPSHFSKVHFSICAFDNFDHADRSSLSGTHSDHDTAVVMFQVKPDIIPSKPNVTAMNLPNLTEHFRSELLANGLETITSQSLLQTYHQIPLLMKIFTKTKNYKRITITKNLFLAISRQV